MTTNVVDRQRPLSLLAADVEAAPDVLSRLVALTALTRMTSTWERFDVEQARAEGASWTAIGAALGVSKQAAVKRFGPKDEPAEPVPDVERAPRPGESWAVTTPGGWTLLRFVKQPRRTGSVI